MSTPLLRPQSAPLRFIAARLQLSDLTQVVRQPGVGEALRVTIQYHDGRHPNQVATITKSQTGKVKLNVSYRRANDTSLVWNYDIELARYQTIGAALRRLNFDKLDDSPDVPWYGADLWLVERAAGSFHHDVIIAAEISTGNHREVTALIREGLKEAVRAINP
ncbi:MAG: hypothetical protein KF726_00820 [Anaerolineae bacterium]|nr:hypothetical protein [Anaerolineae bacterium]